MAFHFGTANFERRITLYPDGEVFVVSTGVRGPRRV